MGAHVDRDGVLDAAADLGADCMQIFLSDPGSWKKPPPLADADAIIASPVDIYVHAPYLINVCSPKPNVRYGARKILQQTCDAAAEIEAKAVIVHGGHAEDDINEGPGRWLRSLEMLETDVNLLLENTAGGDNAVARRFDALARLWDAIGDADHGIDLGFCFDTCHAHAAGEDLGDAVERAIAITGGIELLHANDSRDPAGTGADRHERLGEGKIDPDALRGMIRAAVKAGAAVIVETPRDPDGLRADLEYVRQSIGS
jgi:deoxyribonuclease-4